MLRSTLVLLALPLMLGTAACTADAADDGDGDESEAAVMAQEACPTAAYKSALASYKSAVAKAKARKAGNVCDGATVMDIAAEAGKAVNTCAAFSNVLKTSQYAAEVRAQMKGTLALASLTGAFKTEGWAGLESALASGVTLHGPFGGVYGNLSMIEFGANGQGTLRRLSMTDQGDPYWTESPITYRVGRDRGELVEIVIDGGGIRSADGIPLLGVEPGLDGAPSFSLEIGDESFSTYPSECEA